MQSQSIEAVWLWLPMRPADCGSGTNVKLILHPPMLSCCDFGHSYPMMPLHILG